MRWQETFALQFFVSRNATFFRLVMKQDVHLQMLQQNVVFLHCNIWFPALQHLVSCIATFGFLHCNISWVVPELTVAITTHVVNRAAR
jgi:hypothetical protein